MLGTREQEKTAGVTVYLIEELGDARMRCDQLLRYVAKASQLIEKSSHKDHFFEVAGDIIRGIPETAFKLHKALQAVALAAGRLDYEEIKQDLRPEKVEELERVLKDVRVRHVQRRSLPNMLKPESVVAHLRSLAKQARQEGSLPTVDLASLIQALEVGAPKVAGNVGEKAAAQLDAMAHALENPPAGEAPSRMRLAQILRRMAADHIDLSDIEEYQKAAFAGEATTATDELDPGVWERYVSGVEENAKQLRHSVNLYVQDSRKYQPQLRNILQAVRALTTLSKVIERRMPKTAAEIDGPASDDLQPRDPEAVSKAFEQILNAARKAGMSVLNGDYKRVMFQTLRALDGIYGIGLEFEVPSIGLLMRVRKELIALSGARPSTNFASVDERRSRYEEGQDADPTENMSDADAKEWKANTEEHKDKFKKEAAKLPEGAVTDLQEMIALLKKVAAGAGDPKRRMIAILSSLALAVEKMGQDEMISNLLDRAASAVQAKWSSSDLKEVEKVETAQKTAAKLPEGAVTDLQEVIALLKKVAAGAGDPKRRMIGILSGLSSAVKKMGQDEMISNLLDRAASAVQAKWSSSDLKEVGKTEKVETTEKTAADSDERRSRYEEGKSADPTKNMSEADAKEWKENTEEHKDKFKKEAAKFEIKTPDLDTIKAIGKNTAGHFGEEYYVVGPNGIKHSYNQRSHGKDLATAMRYKLRNDFDIPTKRVDELLKELDDKTKKAASARLSWKAA